MVITGSIASYNFTTLCLGNSHRVEATNPDLRCPLPTSKHEHKRQFFGKQKFQLYPAVGLDLQDACRTKKIMAVPSGAESGSGSPFPFPFPFPFDPFSGGWTPWILGILVSVILPFSRNKWWPLLKIRDNFKSAVESAENVAETVEKVAEEVEKVTESIAENLPEGGKLKQVVTYVETLAKETDKDAELAEAVLEKVEQDVESLTDQATAATKEKKTN